MRVTSALYKVEIDGLDFSETKRVDGLHLITGDAKAASDFAGKTYNTTVTIQRIFCDTDLLKWITEIRRGNVEKKNGVISFVDESGNKIIGYKIEGCWPIEWDGPEMRAEAVWTGSEVGLETVTLAVEQVSLEG